VSTTLERLNVSTHMLRNYLTSTLRHLIRNRAYTFINVLGLAIGMACTILIYLYVDFEYSWDHFRPNADQVYRVLRKGPTPYSPVHKPFEGLSGQVGPSMVQDFPEVEETCRFRIGAKWARYKDFALRTHFWFGDPNVLDFFGFKLARGDARTALTVPNGIILNPDIVTTYFGDEDPMGKTIEGQDQNYV
jgi:putative ABC transport system permease protein